MHIIEHYFDVGGFDHRLVQGGTSVYLWNLSRSMAAAGHRVSVVAPAHGRLEDLRRYHTVTPVPFDGVHTVTIPLDRRVWRDYPETVDIPLRTTAHRVTIEGVDLYFLSNDMLDRLPDTFYPPYHTKGRDLVFFKPLVFQVDSVRFMRHQFRGERAVIHTHEPFYHYLVPAAFRDDPDTVVASTVQSNMPITKMVYRREVESLLAALDVKVELPAADPVPDGPANAAMSRYQRRTHLHYEYPPEYVNIFALVAEHADLVDFLSPGQLHFYSTFADTPFEALFTRLAVSDVVARNAHKFFVGGCALSDRWLSTDPSTVDRAAVRAELGLAPDRVTFFHNARYAIEHKGQRELMRAVDRVLGDGLAANFIIRCLAPAGIDDPYFHEVARRYPGRVYLEWHQVPEDRIFGYAASADYCVFPSKYEMDTFLIAQGEAMACGAVPIATAQEGMAHFGHVPDPHHGPDRDSATGFALTRAFAEDAPILVDDLAAAMRAAVRLRREQPDEYRRLSGNAARTARQFTWERCARQHLAAFQEVHDGRRPVLGDDTALRNGWFDRVSAAGWRSRAADIAERALARGDVRAFTRCQPLTPESARRLFDAAYARADFAACETIASEAPVGTRLPLLSAVRNRLEIVHSGASRRLRYRMASAQRVELVFQGIGDGAQVLTLGRDGDAFTATLPDPPDGSPLCFLLTLDSGRVAWDVVTRG